MGTKDIHNVEWHCDYCTEVQIQAGNNGLPEGWYNINEIKKHYKCSTITIAGKHCCSIACMIALIKEKTND
jgi:hypothetical protein